MSDEKFILEYERLLDKGYCDCNEMNCIDNDSPRRILRIAKNLQQENQELKKQYEECVKINIADHKYASSCEDKVIVLEAQQKEFIEWLEDKIKQKQKNLKDSSFAMAVVYTKAQIFTLQNALNEYKEIIGGKE